MSEKISALIDKEHKEDSHCQLIESICSDSRAQQRWKRYHLIRSAILGECTKSYLQSVYSETEQLTNFENKQQSTDTAPKQTRFLPFWHSIWYPRMRGYGLATGLACAVLIGFFAFTVVGDRLTQLDGATKQVAISSNQAIKWVASPELISDRTVIEPFLNETLLAHSESSDLSMLSGLSNYARLVAYDY